MLDENDNIVYCAFCETEAVVAVDYTIGGKESTTMLCHTCSTAYDLGYAVGQE